MVNLRFLDAALSQFTLVPSDLPLSTDGQRLCFSPRHVLLRYREEREAVNRDWQAIDEYCRAHKENFYFEDVYSTVGFSRKIFDGVPDGGYANYDILGGWMCNSPLYYEKIGRYGIESAQQGLLEQDNVYWIMSDTEAAQQGFGWLTDYYDAQGITVTVEEADRIGEAYAVYRVWR